MITYILLFLNSIFYLIPNLLDSNLNGGGLNFRKIMDFGALRSTAMDNGEYYRLITSAFLHWNLLHFAVNMYSLYSLGLFAESSFGQLKYITIYLVAAVSGGLFTYFLGSFFGQGPLSQSAGASGAIFGLMGAMIVFVYLNQNQFRNGAMSSLLTVAAINLIIGFNSPNIGNAAHVGGLVSGLIVGFLFAM
jgi:rhomboid protease GluP